MVIVELHVYVVPCAFPDHWTCLGRGEGGTRAVSGSGSKAISSVTKTAQSSRTVSEISLAALWAASWLGC